MDRFDVSEKFMKGLFLFLLVVSVVSFFAGYDVGEFKFSNIHSHLYFQAWISGAIFFLAFIFGWACWIVQGKSRLEEFRLLAWSLFVFALAMVPIGFHNEYCKWCSDLGICGSAHNYPNAISLLAVCLYTVVLVVQSSLGGEKKGEILKLLMKAYLLGFGVVIALLFLSLYAMELPSPIPYRVGSLNYQGFIFLSLSIFSGAAFLQWVVVGRRTRRLLALYSGLAFLVIGVVQLFAAYHIFTCYWCNVEECSEFYSVGGVLLLFSLYLFWRATWVAFHRDGGTER